MRPISKPFYFLTTVGGAGAAAGLLLVDQFVAMPRSMEASLTYGVLGGAVLCSIASLALIHRLWASLSGGFVRTSPAMAVLLLLVPVFNCYWIFHALWGWSLDYRDYLHQQRIDGPPVPPLLPFMCCALALISAIPTIGLYTTPFALLFAFLFFNSAIDGANAAIAARAGAARLDCGEGIWAQETTVPGPTPFQRPL